MINSGVSGVHYKGGVWKVNGVKGDGMVMVW